MDIENLCAFVSVYVQRSFSIAAQHLFITQTAVRKWVALLEGQLQTRLFDLMSIKINPTPAGKEL